MHHFFTEPDKVKEDKIFLEGLDVNHMKNVLRLRVGEEVGINDGEGTEYVCTVDHYEDNMAVLNILSSEKSQQELPSKIYLFQGLPKSDKMELIIQKAVELGVYEVIPVSTRRCVVRLDNKKAAKKVERWQAIALSGAKQSGRGIVPEVKNVMTFNEALKYASNLDVRLIPYELAEGMKGTKELISSIKPGESVGIFIGPEGGFDEEEVNKANEEGVKTITLGKRILRTETAGLTTLSILMFHLEK